MSNDPSFDRLLHDSRIDHQHSDIESRSQPGGANPDVVLRRSLWLPTPSPYERLSGRRTRQSPSWPIRLGSIGSDSSHDWQSKSQSASGTSNNSSGPEKPHTRRRPRTTRYAPEFLEQKLCPSGFAGHAGASALYSTPDPAVTQDDTSSSDPSSDGGTDQDLTPTNTDDTAPTATNDSTNDPGTDDSSDDPKSDDPNASDPALIGPPLVILVNPGSSPATVDPALVPPPTNDPGSNNPAYADPGSDGPSGDAPGSGSDDPSDDDPDPAADDSSDDDPSEPDVPEPPDANGGNPPGVPLPPIPIGPAVPAI